MSDKRRELTVSIYFVWQWWEEHYQRARGRPEWIDMDWLDETYLGRQRFLYEHFGEHDIGQAEPTLDLRFISQVMPFHTMILPVALGMSISIHVGSYSWHPLSVSELRELKPVDLARSPIGELIVRERDARLARYGVATQAIDLGGIANNAFMLRAHEFYADLIVDKGLARHYDEVVAETITLGYRFVSELFGPIKGFPIANCNVTMMSPEVYVDMLRDLDIRLVEYAAELNGEPPFCNLHHCNVRTEPFAEAYSVIPGLASLQGSHLSDIERIHQVLPDVDFSAMVNPVGLLNKSRTQTDQELDHCLATGAHDLAIWDIDTAFGPEKVADLLRRITRIAAKNGRKAVFHLIPITWEEMDWEFPQYRSDFALGAVSTP